MIEFETGTEYEVTVDRIASSGNGIVELENGSHINIGRVTCDPGETVLIEYLGKGIGLCIERDNRSSAYNVTRERGFIPDKRERPKITGVLSRGDSDPSNKNKLLNNLR